MSRNLTYTANELYRLSTQAERRDMECTKDAMLARLEGMAGGLRRRTYSFRINAANGMFTNGHVKGSDDYLFQDLVLRKLGLNIRTIYKLQAVSRDSLVRQVVALLSDATGHYVVRLDVRHFYEKIDFRSMLADIAQGAYQRH